MTENDGLDVIVQASGGSVSAPGVASAAAVRFQQSGTGTWNVETGPACGGPWGAPVLTNQTTPPRRRSKVRSSPSARTAGARRSTAR